MTLAVAAGSSLVLVGGIATVATGAAKDSTPATVSSASSPAVTSSATPSAKTTSASRKPKAKATPKATAAAVRHVFGFPDTVSGLPKLAKETQDLTKDFSTIDTIHGVRLSGAAYGDPAGIAVVMVLPTHLSNSERADAISSLVSSATGDKQIKAGSFVTAPAGSLGGIFQCAKVNSSDYPGDAVGCYWSDDESFGFVLAVRPDRSPGATVQDPSLAVSVREAVEQPRTA